LAFWLITKLKCAIIQWKNNDTKDYSEQLEFLNSEPYYASKKLLTFRQIFRYAVPALTVTKKHWLSVKKQWCDRDKWHHMRPVGSHGACWCVDLESECQFHISHRIILSNLDFPRFFFLGLRIILLLRFELLVLKWQHQFSALLKVFLPTLDF